ncbi:hypothetical protein BHM03_00007218 [Ensete ventricosum]|nr:hypothetical protein BHM03_00007218 [Ensete ventricosum]
MHHEDVNVTFRSEDEEHSSHDDALVISICMANAYVKRVMIDTGSSTDILYLDAFQRLRLTDLDLTPLTSTLTGFTRDSVSPLGTTTIPVTATSNQQLSTKPHLRHPHQAPREGLPEGKIDMTNADLAATSYPRTVGPPTWPTRHGQPAECKYGGRPLPANAHLTIRTTSVVKGYDDVVGHKSSKAEAEEGRWQKERRGREHQNQGSSWCNDEPVLLLQLQQGCKRQQVMLLQQRYDADCWSNRGGRCRSLRLLQKG